MKILVMDDINATAGFKCPGCKDPHYIPTSGPNKWTWNGLTDRPTFFPSILVNNGRMNPAAHVCHSYISEGSIRFLADSTHALAGKTIELPEVGTRADLFYTGSERDDLEEG